MRWREFLINPLKRQLEAVIVVNVVVTETAVVTHPMLVNIFMETWLDAVDTIGFIFHGDVTTHAAS